MGSSKEGTQRNAKVPFAPGPAPTKASQHAPAHMASQPLAQPAPGYGPRSTTCSKARQCTANPPFKTLSDAPAHMVSQPQAQPRWHWGTAHSEPHGGSQLSSAPQCFPHAPDSDPADVARAYADRCSAAVAVSPSQVPFGSRHQSSGPFGNRLAKPARHHLLGKGEVNRVGGKIIKPQRARVSQ
jgi:hypothetical protein